jgi:hypothetical protein
LFDCGFRIADCGIGEAALIREPPFPGAPEFKARRREARF